MSHPTSSHPTSSHPTSSHPTSSHPPHPILILVPSSSHREFDHHFSAYHGQASSSGHNRKVRTLISDLWLLANFYVFIRHGARLDAEDKNWTTSSATPYDPPLSYGGWTQTRALGARIASLLHARDIALSNDDTLGRSCGSDVAGPEQSSKLENLQPSFKLKQRKYKIVVHSSPFLRCIQSSVAVSAGIAQYQGNLARFDAHNRPSTPQAPHLFTVPPRSRTLDAKTFDSTFSESDSASNPPASKTPLRFEPMQKITLRIDAFLGEWLSPDYFEFITAPPPSNMMVAAAKAELLRSAEPIQGSKTLPVEARSTFFPGGWGQHQDSALTNRHSLSMAQVAQALPGHGMSSNGNHESDTAGPGISKSQHSSKAKPMVSGYVPPVPTYALLPKEPIPSGYVAHARDACVNIDFQWDSMRDPQNWGDGGEHGEEWSSMHMRFRRGMLNMISWYSEEGPPRCRNGFSHNGCAQGARSYKVVMSTQSWLHFTPSKIFS